MYIKPLSTFASLIQGSLFSNKTSSYLPLLSARRQ
jgi:hypothetical protein